jgi:DNA-binding MarR family transcriptional regulator
MTPAEVLKQGIMHNLIFEETNTRTHPTMFHGRYAGVMHVLAIKPHPVRINVLAAELQMTQQGIGKTLRLMEASGLIRVKKDEFDRRARLVSLTASGENMYDHYETVCSELA